MAGRVRGRLAQATLDQRRRGDWNTLEPGGAASVEARDLQKIVDQPSKPVGLALDARDEVTLRLRVPLDVGLQQRRGIALDVRERRAELVRDQRDNVRLELLDLTLRPEITQNLNRSDDAAVGTANRRGDALDRNQLTGRASKVELALV